MLLLSFHTYCLPLTTNIASMSPMLVGPLEVDFGALHVCAIIGLSIRWRVMISRLLKDRAVLLTQLSFYAILICSSLSSLHIQRNNTHSDILQWQSLQTLPTKWTSMRPRSMKAYTRVNCKLLHLTGPHYTVFIPSTVRYVLGHEGTFLMFYLLGMLFNPSLQLWRRWLRLMFWSWAWAAWAWRSVWFSCLTYYTSWLNIYHSQEYCPCRC